MDWNVAPLLSDPAAWAALITLVVMEVVLGIDNLIFISILTNKLPEAQRQRARRIGISLALVLRLGLLSTIAIIVGLTAPVFDLGWQGAIDSHGNPEFETAFSWRDLILIAGGLFLAILPEEAGELVLYADARRVRTRLPRDRAPPGTTVARR